MIDKNKKLAEFMGRNGKMLKHLYSFKNIEHNGQVWFNEDELKFDKDWNWLMQVVHKIENIVLPETDNCFNVTIGGGLYCTIQDAYGEILEITTDGSTKILTVHEACVKFVDWYELQK